MIPSPSPQEKQQGSGSTVKLRDSCHACAASKLKCSKERPTCSRCAKRDIPCTYVQSKRKGRKSQSSQCTDSNNSRSGEPMNVSQHQSVGGGNSVKAGASAIPPVPTPNVAPLALTAHSAPPAPMATLAPSTTTSFTPAPCAGMPFPADSSMFMDDFLAPFADPRSSVGSVSADSNTYSYSSNTSFSADYSDLFGKYAFGSMPQISDGLDADTWSWQLSPDTDLSFTDFINDCKGDTGSPVGPISFFGNATSDSVVPASASSINHAAAANGTEAALQEDYAPDSCCILPAMAFLKQIGNKSGGKGEDSTAMEFCGDPRTTQSIATNTRALDILGEILDCSCSSDGHIQVIVSLIILRLLGNYAAEARKASSRQSLPGTAVSEPCEEASPAYVAARRVLGELHCVQRLVAQLSSRINETKAKSNAAAIAEAAKLSEQEANGMLFSFSARTLEQIEIDVRGRLKSLSKELIAVLRRE